MCKCGLMNNFLSQLPVLLRGLWREASSSAGSRLLVLPELFLLYHSDITGLPGFSDTAGSKSLRALFHPSQWESVLRLLNPFL